MTLSEMRTLVGELLALDLDNFKGETPGAADLTTQLNAGLRWVSREIYLFNPKVTLTPVASQAIQNVQDTTTPVVTQKMIRVYSVTINGKKLRKYGTDQVGLWSYAQLETEYPSWEAHDAGVPVRAVQFNEGKIILDPAPSAQVISDGSNFLAGRVYAPPLVNGSGDSTEPDIPIDLHEAVCFVTAVYASDPQIAADEALQRVKRYSARAYDAIQETKSENQNMISRFSFSPTPYPDFIDL